MSRTFQDVTVQGDSVHGDGDDKASTLGSSIHYVPFKVQYDGPADVKILFTDDIYTKPAFPADEKEKPTSKSDKPASKSDKPASESDKPATKSDKPASESDKPASKSDKPSSESDKPASESDKPLSESGKPSSESDKPSSESDKPSSESGKPSSESDKRSSESDEVLLNRFRGRPLCGKKMDLPKNYGGIVITDLQGGTEDVDEHIDEGSEDGNGIKRHAEIGDDKNLSIKITKRFNSITYWNWDKVPSKMDAPVKLMDWLELSQIVHQPVD